MILVCTPKNMREQVIEALSTIRVYINAKFFFTEVRAKCGTKMWFCLPSQCYLDCPGKF